MIHAYNLSDMSDVKLSRYAKILCVAIRYGDVMLWADTDPTTEQEQYKFVSVMTDDEAPKGFIYVTTLLSANDSVVQHIYRSSVLKDIYKSFLG